MLRLLRLIPREEHNAFLLLLRTQPAAQQEALVRLMRSLPTDANLRLLWQVAVLPTDTVDALFELLLLIPMAECPALAKLLTSVNVTTAQLNSLVTVAANMKNQAASRELVMFAADLPPETRAFFFDVLADKVPEKGVLLRMMSLSSRVSLPLLCRLVQLLHRMGAWEVRSAFVEQLRSLELEHEIEEAVDMLCELEVVALRWAVTLLSPFAAQIRATFCRVMLQLGATTERRDVLAKLVEIPKNRIGEFMAAVCDDQRPGKREFPSRSRQAGAAVPVPALATAQEGRVVVFRAADGRSDLSSRGFGCRWRKFAREQAPRHCERRGIRACPPRG